MSTGIKYFTLEALDELLDRAAASARRRTNHNVHPDLGDAVHRFFNAIQPDSYVRPHRHQTPLRWEFFIVLRGHAAILTFDDQGKVLTRTELTPAVNTFGLELPAGCWHSLVALEPTVLFELKEGPYHAPSDKDFAAWAPPEATPQAATFTQWYRHARPGDSYPRG